MKISLVIPAYNEEKLIEKCLKSVKSQTVQADEVIVVDNNSTDTTVEIEKKYDVKIINEKKQGISYARNKGFDSAKYELIARCDSDCILPKTWIKQIKDNFGTNKIDALVGPLYYYDLILPSKQIVIAFIKSLRVLIGHYPLIGPNMAITKNVWKKIKDNVCNDNRLVHEDIDLSLHINKIGGKIRYDENLVNSFSARRLKGNPYSFYIEYPERFIKTIKNHK